MRLNSLFFNQIFLKMKRNYTRIDPYFTFNGNCRTAMEHYQKVLGGKLDIKTFAESPMEVPPAQADNVMHAFLELEGGAILMASDAMPGQEAKAGSNIAVSVNETNQEKAQKIFEGLSQNGVVLMPLEKTFWGALFGMCLDEFGITWMVNCQIDEQ